MKKIIFVVILIIFSCNFYKNFAYDTTAAKYMPLQVGNAWTYFSSSSNIFVHCFAIEKYTITGTIVINGKMFFTIQRTLFEYNSNSTNCGQFFASSRLFSQNYIRIDSITTNI